MPSHRLGIDAGSTTVKVVLLDGSGSIVFSGYRRHHAAVRETVRDMALEAMEHCTASELACAVTGSAGIALATRLAVPFVQEVLATASTVRHFAPGTDVFVELGGEDAKITFFDQNPEQRMNGTCAGGTGSFIDQMADLLRTDAAGLDRLAADAATIYPIASRCGVFAKTDVQPLLNEGARREDIAASVLQAVVNQTIGGLACGRTVTGRVAFLGGPLHFLPQLRRRFVETLRLDPDHVAQIPEPHLAPALGAALEAGTTFPLNGFRQHFHALEGTADSEIARLPKLFETPEALERFRARHAAARMERSDLATHVGPCWIGIDAGSTTTKFVAIDASGRILFERYAGNEGRPLESAAAMLRAFREHLPEGAHVAGSCATGYGEALVRAGLSLDMGEIETIAHCRAAETFLPGVERIIDIGGQDMKCIRLKDGAVEDILLNEACSSGCGSFIENAAHTLDLPVGRFALEALSATRPVDLGSRCTVFMNSRIKQAQKEGASVADISAGLAYAVVRNVLHKVLRLRSAADLGSRVVVQGGTFLNEGILRCFELETGREVVRPELPGLMGALGAALVARDTYDGNRRSATLDLAGLDALSTRTAIESCKRCTNRCMLTRTVFSTGDELVAGNRCERGAREADPHPELPDMFDWKYRRIFGYTPLDAGKAPRGSIGIPRALNLFEHYPFWFTFFTELGFRVELSPHSSRAILELGMDTIPSESVCYPAKLAHGHVRALARRGVRAIFHPCLPFERREHPASDNHFACPIAGAYPELLRTNVPEIADGTVLFLAPFLPIDDGKRLSRRLFEELSFLGLGRREIERAVEAAEAEAARVRAEIRAKGEEILEHVAATGGRAVVLAGRPYHTDPEIHHGIPGLIRRHGFAVLTEDAIEHLGDPGPLRVVDQWTFHSRLYRAAAAAAARPGAEFVQLVSFGCGLDAVTTDQVHEILARRHRFHTVVKIDEGANLGAARIRVRSLDAAVRSRAAREGAAKEPLPHPERAVFTPAMRATHTLLTHQVSPMHYQFVEAAFRAGGYDFVVLPSMDRAAVETGLRHVHNDACYPSIVTVGQMLEAVKSGRYDPDTTALVMVQSGGGCRMTNYIAFLKKALRDAGLERIPVLSFNMAGLEKQPGFTFPFSLINRVLMGLVYGDTLMKLVRRTRPYEVVPGSVDALQARWEAHCKESLVDAGFRRYGADIRAMVEEFEALPLRDERKPRVGTAGEVLVKYHPTVNNDLVELLEREGAEVVVPNLVDWILYCAFDSDFQYRKLSASKLRQLGGNFAVHLMERYRAPLRKALSKSRRFTQVSTIHDLARHAEPILSLGNQTGEGWYLTAEMVEMIQHGAHNIVCMQPFACLPNHITGKGMHKAIRDRFPQANIVSIDYDPGASEVNQLNRIKLMLERAKATL